MRQVERRAGSDARVTWSALRDAVKAWARDELIQRLVKNVTYLFSANIAVALLSLASMALVARALGPAAFGILVMIEAYAYLVDLFVRIEPWHAVIRYGAEALERRASQDFKRLIKFATLIDLGGAALAAAIAIAAAPLAGRLLGWSDATIDLARLFSLAIAVHLTATPTAVLRLFDRFGLLASRLVVLATLRLVLVAAVFLGGGGLLAFLLLSMLGQILESLIMLGMAWRELRAREYGDALLQPVRGVVGRHPGLWGFIWSSNVSLLFRKSTQHFDTLIVGGLIDPAAAGLYNVAKRLGGAVLKLGTPIQQAIYPDIARLWARGELTRFKKTVIQVGVVPGTAAGLFLVLLSLEVDRLTALVVGESFRGASDLIVVQMLAATIFLFGVALRPAILSMGRHQHLLALAALATLLFYAWLVVSLPALGVLGASWAHVVFNVVWVGGMLVVLRRGARAAAASAVQRPSATP
jgi:O-antigen/teichoic acid export membrane protein